MVAYGVNAEKVGRLLKSFNRSQRGHTVRVFRAWCSDDERGGDRYNGPVGGFERDRLQFLRKGQSSNPLQTVRDKQERYRIECCDRRKTSIVNKGWSIFHCICGTAIIYLVNPQTTSWKMTTWPPCSIRKITSRSWTDIWSNYMYTHMHTHAHTHTTYTPMIRSLCIIIDFSATVTNLQAKVESLTTTNALMKEDLSIAKNNILSLHEENRQLKKELGIEIKDTNEVRPFGFDPLSFLSRSFFFLPFLFFSSFFSL